MSFFIHHCDHIISESNVCVNSACLLACFEQKGGALELTLDETQAEVLLLEEWKKLPEEAKLPFKREVRSTEKT